MNKDFYISLFQKKMLGTISEKEQESLSSWVKASPENQTIINELNQAWDFSGNYSNEVEHDLDEEFSFLEEKIKFKSFPQQKIVPIKKQLIWWRIAASIAAIVIAGFVINNMFSNKIELFNLQTDSSQKKEIMLADGSKIWLNENSIFSYPKDFKGKFRNVKLQGEAFFEVKSNKNKPFVIELSQGINVEVLGTSFNVRDYKSEDFVEVQVRSGRVAVQSSNATQNEVILTQNEIASVNKTTNRFIKNQIASQNNFAWYNSQLTFDKTPLQQCIEDIERSFSIAIHLERQELKFCPFTSNFKSKEAHKILETIAEVFDMELIKNGSKNFELKGGDCH